jgi:hypothetical protein
MKRVSGLQVREVAKSDDDGGRQAPVGARKPK